MRWIITILPDAGTHSGIVGKSPFMARRIRSPRHGARYVFSMRAISLGASAPLWRRCDGRTEPVAASMRRSGGTARTTVQISAGCRAISGIWPVADRQEKTSGRAPVCSSIRKWKPRRRMGGRNEAEAGSGRADHRHSEGGRGTAGDLWKNETARSTVSIYSRLLRMPCWLGDTCIRVDASPSFLKPAYADTALTTRLATAVSAHHG